MPGYPRNKGLEYSHGKYVFFADNDDLIDAFKIIFNVYLFKIMNTKMENDTEIKK